MGIDTLGKDNLLSESYFETYLEKLGCRLQWDGWRSLDIPVCTTVQQIHSFEREFYFIQEINLQSEILRDTGCHQPCQFTEYKLASEPLREKGSALAVTLLLSSLDITSKREEILFDFQSFVLELDYFLDFPSLWFGMD